MYFFELILAVALKYECCCLTTLINYETPALYCSRLAINESNKHINYRETLSEIGSLLRLANKYLSL
jgi:hypothetical protein